MADEDVDDGVAEWIKQANIPKAVEKFGAYFTRWGWIVVVLAAVFLFFSFGFILEKSNTAGWMVFIGGFSVMALGLLMVIGGKIVCCMAAISRNTEKTNEVIRLLKYQRNHLGEIEDSVGKIKSEVYKLEFRILK